jgi:hypothetical protein
MLEAYLNFQKICRSWIFQNLQKIRGFHERTDGFLAGYLICYNFFWKPWLFIKIGSFILLRAMVMNNIKNLPDNCGGGVCFLFLSNYLTVVQSPNPVRLWELDNHKRTLQIMLAARTRGGEERARVNQHPPQCGWVLVHPRVEKRAWNSWVLTLLHLIYKSKRDVCLFVCHDKQCKAGRPGQTPTHSRSFSVKPGKATVVVSVCVGTVWKILQVIARCLWSFPRCNFPRCNWLQRKKKSGAVWFFEAKDLVDQKKNI